MHSFFTFITLILLTATTLMAEDLEAIQKNTHDQNPKVRIAAMGQLAEAASRDPETTGKAALPIFIKGMSDPDSDVRSNAISGIAVTVIGAQFKFHEPKRDSMKIGNLPSLQTGIEKLLDDPDEFIRENALRAYVNLYDLNPKIQAHLISHLNSSETLYNQEFILEFLANTSAPSEAAVACLLKNLDGSQYSLRIARTWAQSKTNPPLAALPKLVELLSSTSESSDRQAYGMAIGRYGAAAKPYLSEIEKLQDKETDPSARQSLKTTADLIRKE